MTTFSVSNAAYLEIKLNYAFRWLASYAVCQFVDVEGTIVRYRTSSVRCGAYIRHVYRVSHFNLLMQLPSNLKKYFKCICFREGSNLVHLQLVCFISSILVVALDYFY